MMDEVDAAVRDLLRVRALIMRLASSDPFDDDYVAIESPSGRFCLVPREAPIPAGLRRVDATTFVRVR